MKVAIITEEQIKLIQDFFQATLPSQDLELENEVSDILRSLKPSEPDLFWELDEPENGCSNIDDLINNYDEGDELEILRAKQLPSIKIKITIDEGGSFDYEVVGDKK